MLSSSIPSSLARLKRLQQLHLQGNRLEGSIPTELGGIIGLQRLELHNNNLTGAIPSELGQFLGLQVLTLQDNDLTGDMPLEICALTDDGRIDDLEVLHADCLAVINCTCCSKCF